MKRALSSLTGRGRLLFVLGPLLALTALTLGDRDLGRLAVLLIALPLLSAAATSRSRDRLRSERSLSAARIPAGDTVQVRIRINNESRVPSGVLLAEDTLPTAFGGRPRFVVDRLRPLGGVTVDYPIRCELRGRYRVGPLTVRLRDPFGLSERTRAFQAGDDLVVTPVVVPLPAVPLAGEWAGLGDTTRRSVATAGEDDAATREYRLGDDLRRVHWRSTARRGELMVRREEQPWASRAALLLDTRAAAHAGSGSASSLEWAVSAAASVGSHLDEADFGLRLVFDGGGSLTSTIGQRFTDALLDGLAVAQPSHSRSLRPGLATLGQGGGEGLIVAVVGCCDVADVEAMIQARSSGVTGVAILLDAASWGPTDGPRPDAAARLLTGAGWRVVTAQRDSDIRDVWQRAGTRMALDLSSVTGQLRPTPNPVLNGPVLNGQTR